jgi:predicted nucleotidyltransferase
MAEQSISEIKPEQWAAIFEPEPVIAAYLFGSQARGGTGPLSDVDVAV